MKKHKSYSRDTVVYSTDPEWKPDLAEDESVIPVSDKKPVVRIELDKKQRAGKKVTVISSVPASEIDSLCKQLKTRCATGGTVKKQTIELQGDQRKKVSAELLSLNYKVKIIGL
jgi:translation initiation factor 1